MNMIIFQYGSAVIGGFAILSVCFVFIKNHTFKISGFGLLISGTILIGLPVWSTAKFAWNKEGFEFEFNTISERLSEIDNKVEAVSLSNSLVTSQIRELSEDIDKVQNINNLALAAFSSSPSLRYSKSPLVKAYSSIALGQDSEIENLIDLDAEAIKILKKTSELTNKLSDNVENPPVEVQP